MTRQIRVLFVDDDERLLQGLKRALRKDVRLVTATTAVEGLRALDKDGPFSVVVSDQNMPKINGSTFLAKAAQHFPTTVRIMLTGNNDQGTAIAAVNDGQVFRFLTKPCNAKDLLSAVEAAHAHHLTLKGERAVLEETVSGSVKLLTDMLSMAHPMAFKRAGVVRQWTRAVSKPLEIDDKWELDVAAMLWPLSYVIASDELIARRNSGAALSDDDKRAIAKSYLSVATMLRNIPRLQGVAQLLLMSCDGAAEAVEYSARPKAAHLLRILINLSFVADPANPASLTSGLQTLAQSGEQYDETIMAALGALLTKDTNDGDASQMRAVGVFELRVGDLLVSDLVDDQDRLLLAAGQTVSDPILTKIARLSAANGVSQSVRVVRPKAAA